MIDQVQSLVALGGNLEIKVNMVTIAMQHGTAGVVPSLARVGRAGNADNFATQVRQDHRRQWHGADGVQFDHPQTSQGPTAIAHPVTPPWFVCRYYM